MGTIRKLVEIMLEIMLIKSHVPILVASPEFLQNSCYMWVAWCRFILFSRNLYGGHGVRRNVIVFVL